MSRRSSVSDDDDDDATGERRSVSNRSSSSSSSSSRERSGSAGSSCGGAAAPQFVAIHSRVGKKYQAVIPELLIDATELREKKKQVLQLPRPRYCRGRAQGMEIERERLCVQVYSTVTVTE